MNIKADGSRLPHLVATRALEQMSCVEAGCAGCQWAHFKPLKWEYFIDDKTVAVEQWESALKATRATVSGTWDVTTK